VSISGATTPAAPLEDRLDAGELHRLVSAVPGQHGDGPAGLDLAVLGHGVLEERGDLAAVLHNLRLLSDQYDLVLVNAGRLVSDPSAFALLRAVGMVVLVAGGSRRLDPADVPEARRLLALAGRAIDALVFVAGPPSGRRRPSVSSRPSASPTPAAPAPAMSTRPGAATPAP